MQLAAFLCEICAICGRIFTQEYSIETPKSPADPADNRRQTPNPKTTRFPICLSLRNNTACCIPLRHLRNLRENKHVRALNRNPKVSRRSRRLRRQTTNNKQQNILNLKQPVFLCEIIQLVVFLCVICAICGKITRKSTQTIRTNAPR